MKEGELMDWLYIDELFIEDEYLVQSEEDLVNEILEIAYEVDNFIKRV